MTLRDAWTPWLGPAADIITDEQLDQLATASRVVDERWPDDADHQDERNAALSAAAQLILGDSTLEEIATAWRRTVLAEAEARAALTGALLASSTGARSGSGSEADLIARSGASRMTVRKALGKRPTGS